MTGWPSGVVLSARPFEKTFTSADPLVDIVVVGLLILGGYGVLMYAEPVYRSGGGLGD